MHINIFLIIVTQYNIVFQELISKTPSCFVSDRYNSLTLFYQNSNIEVKKIFFGKPLTKS